MTAIAPTSIDNDRRGIGWLEDQLRWVGRHRRSRGQAARDAIHAALIALRGLCVTMTKTAGRHAWSLAWPAAFTGAGFTVNVTVGLVVLGFACLWMDLRTDSSG